MEIDIRADARLWLDPAGLALEGEALEAKQINLEVERSASSEVALHTFIDGESCQLSIYLYREDAIDLARQILNQSMPGMP